MEAHSPTSKVDSDFDKLLGSVLIVRIWLGLKAFV
jgi:hypothetical protein